MTTALLRFLRSMLGQTVLLSLLFAGVGVYVFAVRPLLDIPPLGRPDAREMTLSIVGDIMWEATRLGGNAKALAARIDSNPAIEQLQQRNPGFRYIAISGAARVGSAAPRYLVSSGVSRMITARRQIRSDTLCTQWEQTYRRPSGIDKVSFIDCGSPRYFELLGIVAPIDVAMPSAREVYMHWAWTYSRGFLLPAFGIFVICATILVFHLVRIWRIARLVHPLEGNTPLRPLGERGLPSEMLPIIRAVNRVLAEQTAGEGRRQLFMSAAAHELRTPLTVLRTRLELLDDCDEKERLIADVRRLARLVNDLLTLTRIGERPPALVPTILAAAVRKAVDALDPVAIVRGVVLQFQIAGASTVLGDAALIEVAASNLIDNALAATPAGGTVRVSVDGDGGLVVADDGPGIAADRVAAIFEPFVRLSDRQPGHGLGLAIVQAVANAHRATLNVASEPMCGSTFTIRFAEAAQPLDGGIGGGT